MNNTIRTLPRGGTDSINRESGFVLLRGLIVMFIVIICFALILAGMVAFAHRSGGMIERAEREIQSRNERALEIGR